MSEDFRQQLHWEWTVKRFWNAAAAERLAGDAIERYINQNVNLELRPPCRRCGQWPCVCND